MASYPSDLELFHQFVEQQLARGVEGLSPEDCLDQWRENHPLPAELAEGLAAIEEGVAQARRGEGTPLDEFTRRFREAKGIPDNGV